jgi:hypothetical protein
VGNCSAASKTAISSGSGWFMRWVVVHVSNTPVRNFEKNPATKPALRCRGESS